MLKVLIKNLLQVYPENNFFDFYFFFFFLLDKFRFILHRLIGRVMRLSMGEKKVCAGISVF